MKRHNARRRTRAVRRVGVWCALGIAFAVPAAPAASESDLTESRAVVEELHENLLQSMRAGSEWTFEERRARLDPVVQSSFDFAFMAEKATGRHWQELSPEQHRELTETMAELASANYAARFRAYDGERFETSGVEPATHNTILVRTRLVPNGAESVALDYRLRRPDANRGLRIVDVFLDGTVSELALRRAEYSSVLQREGFGALLTALRQKIAAARTSGKP